MVDRGWFRSVYLVVACASLTALAGASGCADSGGSPADERLGEAGSAGTGPHACGAAECGAELAGVWEFDADCAVEREVYSDTQLLECEPTLVRQHYAGTIEFDAEGALKRDYTVVQEETRVWSAACLAAAGREAPSEANCASMAREASQFLETETCVFVDAACRCEAVSPVLSETGSPTYTAADYCADADRMTITVNHYVNQSTSIAGTSTLSLVRVR